MIEAIRICENMGRNFQKLFARQFVLSQSYIPTFEGWSQNKFGSWHLWHDPKLEVGEIIDSAGHPVGWLLGLAVDEDGILFGGSCWQLNFTLSHPDFWELLEDKISKFAGRYLVIALTQRASRIYFDPVVDLPCVYNPKAGLIASSALLALNRPLRENHRVNHKIVAKNGGNYGMQQTCDPDVHRVMANHYLDLGSYTLHRHWPSKENSFEQRTAEESADIVIPRLAQIMAALIRGRRCQLALSGGGDSRILAFTAKSHVSKLSGVYTHKSNWITQFDCLVATRLADKLGCTLNILDAVSELRVGRISRPEIRQLRQAYILRTGYHAPAENRVLVATNMVPEGGYVLRGNVLDMSRANQWPRDFKFSVEHGVSKLVIGGRPLSENYGYWGAEYRNWMDTLPSTTHHRIYDFAFCELLLPNTLGANLQGHGRTTYLNPYNDRSLIAATLSVPPKIRKSGKLLAALLHACDAPAIPLTRHITSDPEAKAAVAEMFGTS